MAKTQQKKGDTVCAPDPLAYEKAHFARLCEQHLRSARTEGEGIGTLREKRLHALLKDYMCEDKARQEVRLDDHIITGRYPVRDDKIIRRDADRYVADILTEAGEIIEIQTGGFFPLIKKIDFYLRMTDCRVTVVHPIPARKWLRWIEPDSGKVGERHRSPKHGGVRDVARELYWIAPYLAEPRFSLQLELLEVEEVRLRDGWGRDGKRGSHRYEYIPLALLDEVVLACPEDYAEHFLPNEDTLPSPFTAAQYARATGLRGKAAYALLHILTDLGFLAPADKIGRAGAWKRL